MFSYSVKQVPIFKERSTVSKKVSFGPTYMEVDELNATIAANHEAKFEGVARRTMGNT